MAFCGQCGSQITEGTSFCTNCGAKVNQQGTSSNQNQGFQQSQGFNQNQNYSQQNQGFGFQQNPSFGADFTNEFEFQDIEANKVMSLFSYLGILLLIPLLAIPNSRFARFHVNQGIILLILSVGVGIISGTLATLTIISKVFLIFGILGYLLSLGMMALMIIGIINAVSGKAKELPLIGKFRILK